MLIASYSDSIEEMMRNTLENEFSPEFCKLAKKWLEIKIKKKKKGTILLGWTQHSSQLFYLDCCFLIGLSRHLSPLSDHVANIVERSGTQYVKFRRWFMMTFYSESYDSMILEKIKEKFEKGN